VLKQRIGRIYRLGQKKHINVFNFIAKGTIEHRILHLLDFKKSVFTGVIEDEGKDEVMLEGFMESVRALTEVNTEAFIRNSSLDSVLQKTENELFSKEVLKNPPINNPLEAPEKNKPEESAGIVKVDTPSGSFFKKLGGLIRMMAEKVLGKK